MLIDDVTWTSHPVPATAAVGNVGVRVGHIGSGSPVGLLVASQHGDEGPWGGRAIRKVLETTPASDLRGTLRIVPMANPLAFEEGTREAHIDLEDLNFSFPGNSDGRHTERLAHVLATNAVDGSDYVIDIHGGGSWCLNAFVYRFEGSYDLADWIGASFVRTGYERGDASLTCYARNRGAKVVWIEMGGAGAQEEQWAQRVATGIRRALGKAGILAEADLPAAPAAIELGESKSLRAPAPGLYLPVMREDDVATIVPAGTTVGHLLEPVTHDIVHIFAAPFERTAVLLIRPTLAVVEGGEMIAALAKVD